ncbi:hypothetical protein M9458_056655, partial [Cirrhinus mrigala]
PSREDSPEEVPSSRNGHNLAPASRSVDLYVWFLDGVRPHWPSQGVVVIITQASAPSVRQASAL